VTASHKHSKETQMVSVPHSTIDMCSLSPASVPACLGTCLLCAAAACLGDWSTPISVPADLAA
jgi:hypothetical protein